MKPVNTDPAVKNILVLAAFDKISEPASFEVLEAVLHSVLERRSREEYPPHWYYELVDVYQQLIYVRLKRQEVTRDKPKLTVIQGAKTDDRS